ncbi:uncharacterized protein LOC116619181 [Nematostella vectensis]|uniref:uncharacterized protein LOC116619181 n=1 Tax=Nematostella vectensis TaxID=45351 RepID=UPI00138FB644|nr:uncharacterized protein LOC116619181 [Nematostella vectensis]
MSQDPEARVSVPKVRFKSVKLKLQLVQYYVVLGLLVVVASLPTGFFILHRGHAPHSQPQNGSKPSEGVPLVFEFLPTDSASDKTEANTTQPVPIPLCNQPLVPDRFNICRLPCDWSSMSLLTYRMYYGLMVVGFWLAVFAAIFTIITWSKIPSLRKFPHNLRFYLIVCCIVLACCKMLPLRIGLKKIFCDKIEYWSSTGNSSPYITIQGVFCHYFSLATCMWAVCFVANTYAVVVKDNRKLFDRPTLLHFAQSLACWLVPAIIIACGYYSKYPDPLYTIAFIDWMGAMPSGNTTAYVSLTLPMQITLGVSLCLLWNITWYIRRARLDNTRHTIRADEDTKSMLRIERQFRSMAAVLMVVLGVGLSITTFITYHMDNIMHSAEEFIYCLKNYSQCQPVDLWVPLFVATMLAPSILCIVFFFLLFMNRDCRQIWTSCFQRVARVTTVCRPVAKASEEITKSRCSSTLTILSERRMSDFALRDLVRREKPRSSSALCVHSLTPNTRRLLSPLTRDSRPRSSSTPSPHFPVSVTNMEVNGSTLSRAEESKRFTIEVHLIDDITRHRADDVRRDWSGSDQVNTDGSIMKGVDSSNVTATTIPKNVTDSNTEDLIEETKGYVDTDSRTVDKADDIRETRPNGQIRYNELSRAYSINTRL